MDSALTGVSLDVQISPGDILMAQVFDAHDERVGEPERVRTNADVEWLREQHRISKDDVRCSPEVRRILDVNSLE